jgi:hypothetical protein
MTGKTNLAASVAARLLNRARQTGDDYQFVLTSDCLERFLYRLAVSDRRERFVFEGAPPRALAAMRTGLCERVDRSAYHARTASPLPGPLRPDLPIVGYADKQRLLFVSHCRRGDRHRIISVRRATRRERRQHEEGIEEE